jgi:8-oxo-dGTP pyrophosphatase MutT (NUDIX family)
VELATLAAQWGPVPLEQRTLAVDDPFLTGVNQKLTESPRRAEICYILHRGDPAAGVLFHIKRFYPTGAFRLPTGGIHQGESVMATLAREIQEETGQVVGDAPGQVQIERCLGVVVYELAHRSLGHSVAFATYHFLARMPADGILAPQDPEEQIAAWDWRPPTQIRACAEYLEQVGRSTPAWADWGRFRALSHRFVAQALSG